MFFAIFMSILLLMIDLYDTVVFAMDLQYGIRTRAFI